MVIVKMKGIGKKRGFSLAEFLMALLLFSILSTSLMGTLVIGLRYYRRSSEGVEAQKKVKNTIEFIEGELRQAVIDPVPGVNGNPPTGYLGVDPPIGPTGILKPNIHQKESNELVFNEPDYDYYDPANPSWFPLDPRNYKKVRYYVKDKNTIMREEIKYSQEGAPISSRVDPVLSFPQGEVHITCKLVFLDDSSVIYNIEIQVDPKEGKSYNLSTGVSVPSEF